MQNLVCCIWSNVGGKQSSKNLYNIFSRVWWGLSNCRGVVVCSAGDGGLESLFHSPDLVGLFPDANCGAFNVGILRIYLFYYAA